ncbi:MAG: hypothetical protein WCP28_22265, partial [Actinomycetes bacterium]
SSRTRKPVASSSRRRPTRRHVERTSATGRSMDVSADLGTEDIRMLSNEEVETRRAGVASGSWEPIESPLPSYVNGPRATSFPRNLDSTANGDWTSERMWEQAEALRTPGADEEAELGLDAFVDVPRSSRATEDLRSYQHRRAVND